MHAPLSRLRRDQRGMLMVVAVPMAAVLAVCLWYLAGIGDALLYRERLQDAADATAFEGAVLHARGMNGIAMLNILLSLLLATLAALRAAEVLALSSLLFGGAGAPAPPSDPALGGRILETMAMISRVQQGVAAATPVLASVSSASDSIGFYGREGAADDVVAISHALLPTRIDDRIGVHPLHRWSLDTRAGASGATRLGAHALAGESEGLPSLPVARDASDRLCREAAERAVAASQARGGKSVGRRRGEAGDRVARLLCQVAPAPARMLDDAENGNVLLQVWAAAERATPGSRARFSSVPSAADDTGTATAQAEYFFACSAGREAWSACRHDAPWSLGWSARMRRVWSPTDALSGPSRRLLQSALGAADARTREGLSRLGVRGSARGRATPRAPLSARRLFDALESDARPGWIH